MSDPVTLPPDLYWRLRYTHMAVTACRSALAAAQARCDLVAREIETTHARVSIPARFRFDDARLSLVPVDGDG